MCLFGHWTIAIGYFHSIVCVEPSVYNVTLRSVSEQVPLSIKATLYIETVITTIYSHHP